MNRRAVLRHGFREAVRGVSEVTRQVNPLAELLKKEGPAPRTAEPEPARPVRSEGPEIVPAEAASRKVSVEELLGRAAEGGLESRLGPVRSLARMSVRATVAEAGAGGNPSSWLGGEPGLGDAAWPELGGEPMPFVGRVELPADIEGCPGGSIAVFVAAGGRGPEGEPPRAAVVALPSTEEPAARADPEQRATPLRLSHELQLPRVWSSPVREHGLSAEGRGAWESLRLWLAEEQGVIPFDKRPGVLGLHRILGNPDERSGDMPLLCEMRTAGVAELKRSPRGHPEWRGHEEAAGRWRLLLQVTRDAATAPHFSGGDTRLYLLVPADDLSAGDFSRVEAVFR